MLKERTVNLKDLPEQLKHAMNDIRQRVSGLRDVVVGLSACKCPTTFVIVPDVTESHRLRWRNKLASGVTPDTLMSDAEVDVAEADALSWVKDLTSVFQVPDRLLAMVDRFRMRRYKLKLVCDKCASPCEPGYLIEKSSDTLVELLPMLQVSFKVLQALNVASSIARCFFPPLPVLPAEYMNVIKGALATVEKKSSVEQFSFVQDTLDNNLAQHVQASASKLVQFLRHTDPMNQWGGLTCVVLDEGEVVDGAHSKGPVLWCCNTCMSVMSGGVTDTSDASGIASIASGEVGLGDCDVAGITDVSGIIGIADASGIAGIASGGEGLWNTARILRIVSCGTRRPNMSKVHPRE